MTSTASGGCCSSINNGSQIQDYYISCLCAGDAVLSGLSAFVDTSAVMKACSGCSTSSEVALSRVDLPTSMTTSATTSTTATKPDSGTATSTSSTATTTTDGQKSTSNPVAMDILASQGP